MRERECRAAALRRVREAARHTRSCRWWGFVGIPGLAATGTPFERIADRRDAIAFALAATGPAYIVLVAGKGSEPYQSVGDRLIPFSDTATVPEPSAPRD